MGKKLSLLVLASVHSNIVALSKDYPFEISAKASKDVAEIRITGAIHQYQNSAGEFKRQVDELLKQGIKNVKLYINSPGGSVFEANEIVNEIKRFTGKIKGYGGALVASAGTYIALNCDEFEMSANGQYMYHKPLTYTQGNEDKITSELKLLHNLTNQYRTAYANKTGMSEDEIESRWSKGDVWLSAKEAMEQGFISSVSNDKQAITANDVAMITACGAPIIPAKTENINQKNSMTRDQIIAAFKLSADATDEQIQTAITASQEDAAKYQASKASTDAKEKELAGTLVQTFVESKQISADAKEQWMSMALKDYEGTKAILATLPKPSKLSEKVDETVPEGTKANWTLEDYLAKDPDALNALASSDPEKFKKLNNEYYK